MALRNSLERYGSIAIFFHWIIFLLIVGMLIAGFTMGNINDDDLQKKIVFLHKSTGLLILFLMILRLLWALSNPKPTLPTHMNTLAKLLAHSMHWLLYVLLIAMPISGILLTNYYGHPPTFFGLFTLKLPITPNDTTGDLISDIHGYLAWAIIILGGLHSLAGLAHHYVYKDNVLRRILPGGLG